MRCVYDVLSLWRITASSIIFRGEYQEPQNSGLKYIDTDAIVHLHTRLQP